MIMGDQVAISGIRDPLYLIVTDPDTRPCLVTLNYVVTDWANTRLSKTIGHPIHSRILSSQLASDGIAYYT